MVANVTNGTSSTFSNPQGRVGFDMAGITPAPVTPFNEDGSVNFEAIQRIGPWLVAVDGVKGLVMLGHAGVGTILTEEAQDQVIQAFLKPSARSIAAGFPRAGDMVAGLEAKRAKDAGAAAGLLYPSHGWLRFGYHTDAPQARYKAVYDASHLPLIMFQCPAETKTTYSLQTQLNPLAQPGVFAMKNGVRNMRQWDPEIPVIRRERPDCYIMTCHDEYLLHTAFDVDGMLIGYGCIAPEPLFGLLNAGKAKNYKKAREVHDKLLPVTVAVYHRGSHMEGTVALKHALVARGILNHATVRGTLLPLQEGADKEIHQAIKSAGLGRAQ